MDPRRALPIARDRDQRDRRIGLRTRELRGRRGPHRRRRARRTDRSADLHGPRGSPLRPGRRAREPRLLRGRGAGSPGQRMQYDLPRLDARSMLRGDRRRHAQARPHRHAGAVGPDRPSVAPPIDRRRTASRRRPRAPRRGHANALRQRARVRRYRGPGPRQRRRRPRPRDLLRRRLRRRARPAPHRAPGQLSLPAPALRADRRRVGPPALHPARHPGRPGGRAQRGHG